MQNKCQAKDMKWMLNEECEMNIKWRMWNKY